MRNLNIDYEDSCDYSPNQLTHLSINNPKLYREVVESNLSNSDTVEIGNNVILKTPNNFSTSKKSEKIMEYIQKIKMGSSEKIITHVIANCLKCNYHDIDITEYEDRYGYISTATCKNKSCKNQVNINGPTINVINKWNQQNDINTLIDTKLQLIKFTQTEIKDLKILQRSRKK